MAKYYSGDHIIKNEMGAVCGQVHAGFWWGAGAERKRPLGRPRRRGNDNIKMNVQEMGQGVMGWIDLAEDRDRCPALVGDELSGSIKCGEFLDWLRNC